MKETNKHFGQWYNFNELYALANGESCGEKILDAVIEALRTHADVCSEEVAAHLGANRRDLSGAVRILTGMTLDAMVKEWRLRQAYEMVQDTDLDFDEIAQKCGYSQPKTLVVAFEKKYHVSPYECRNGHHRNGIRLYRKQQEKSQKLSTEVQDLNSVQDCGSEQI